MQHVKRIAYRFDGFCLDPGRRLLLSHDGQPIPLRPRAFDALLCLVEHAGALLERQELLRAIWPKAIVHENNLDQAISAVRRALGETRDDHRFIVTEPGRGYRFVARVETIPVDDVQGRSAGTDATAAQREPYEPVPASSSARAQQPETIGSAAPAATARQTAARRPYRTLAAATVAAAAIAVAALVAGIRDVREPVSDPSALQVRPLSSERGGQRSAVWSPDGSAVAFAARPTASEPFQVYVRPLDSRAARPITRIDTSAVVKQWTTAGRLLLVDRSGLWSVSPAGAPAELIERIDAARYDLSDAGVDVARDGSAAAVLSSSGDGVFGVSTTALPDGTLEKYEPAPFATRRIVNRPFVRFSPDGEQLLLIRNAGEGEQAWLLPFPPDETRPPRRILESLRKVSGTPQFSWLPDNRHIVVSAATQARRELYLADTHSGELRLLSRGQRDHVAPVVSPDGNKLVFGDLRTDLDVVTLDLATAAATPLISTRRAEQMPAWARGSQALVYVTDRSGPMEIWLRRPGRRDEPLVTGREFPSATRWLIAPALSPDGTRVIYQRVETPGEGPARLWMSGVDGGGPQRVTSEEDVETAGSWSPDGAWYVYRTLETNGWSKLKKVRTTGRAEPETLLEIVQSSGFVPAWSPDGGWLLIADRGMKLVSADGETTRELGIENAPCAFARAEPLLYCIRTRQQDGTHALVAMDFEGNVRRTIGSVASAHLPVSSLSPGLRLSPTPDGSGLTYAAGRASQDLWLMDGISALVDR